MYGIVDNEIASNAFRRCLKKASFIYKLTKSRELKIFKEVQKENKAYTNSYLGIRNVPLEKIVGSVEKFTDFYADFTPKSERVQERWCRIYIGMTKEGAIPPPILYKIKDEYFVYDGNHRISVAKYLNFKIIEAEVYEFIPGLMGKEDLVYTERFTFEKDTGLDGIEVSEPGGYDRLRREIERFKYQSKDEEADGKRMAFEWKRRIFNPVVKIYFSNNRGSSLKNGEAYLDFLDFKHAVSESRNYDIGFTLSLVEYINSTKVLESSNLETSFYLDRDIINEFRRIYNVDRIAFYSKDFVEKIFAIREYRKIRFRRENLIVGEIELYKKLKEIPSFIFGMQQWFDNVYDEYEKEFLEKLKNIGTMDISEIDYIEDIVEDIIRYSRYYRKKYKRLLTTLEIVFSYILDIFIPAMQLIKEMGVKKEEVKERYFNLTQSYLYYVRYGGDAGIKEFEKKYLKRENTQFNLMSLMIPRKEGDIFRDIKKLISYYAVTSHEGLEEISRFYDIIEKYGGTESYGTVSAIRDYMINVCETADTEISFVKDYFEKQLLELSKDKEIRVNYNTKRILNCIKGVWGKYTFIDYYAQLIKLKQEGEDILEAGKKSFTAGYRY